MRALEAIALCCYGIFRSLNLSLDVNTDITYVLYVNDRYSFLKLSYVATLVRSRAFLAGSHSRTKQFYLLSAFRLTVPNTFLMSCMGHTSSNRKACNIVIQKMPYMRILRLPARNRLPNSDLFFRSPRSALWQYSGVFSSEYFNAKYFILLMMFTLYV